MKKFRNAFLALLMPMLLVISACQSNDNTPGAAGDNAESRVFKIATNVPDNSIWVKVMKTFDEELRAKSEGRLGLEIFTGGVLGYADDMMLQMKEGSLDMAFIPSSNLLGKSGSFNAWFLPYLIEDFDHLKAMINTPESDAILNSLSPEEGLHPLGYHPAEVHQLFMSKPLANGMDDLAGKAIGAAGGKILEEFFATHGATLTPIPFPETYTSLQTGVVDGVEFGITSVMELKLYELGDYMLKTDYFTFMGVSFMSQKVWDSLSAEDQKIITEAFKVAQTFNVDALKELEEGYFAQFKEQGGTVVELDLEAASKELSEGLVTKYASGNEKIQAFVDKARELASN